MLVLFLDKVFVNEIVQVLGLSDTDIEKLVLPNLANCFAMINHF